MCTGPGMPIREGKRSQECNRLPLNPVSSGEVGGKAGTLQLLPQIPWRKPEACMCIHSFNNSYSVHFEAGTAPSILWPWAPKSLSTVPDCQTSRKQADSQGRHTSQGSMPMCSWRIVLPVTQVLTVLQQSRAVKYLRRGMPGQLTNFLVYWPLQYPLYQRNTSHHLTFVEDYPVFPLLYVCKTWIYSQEWRFGCLGDI